MNRLSKFAGWMLMMACGIIPLSVHAQNLTGDTLTLNYGFTAGVASSTAPLQFRLNGTILSTGSFNWGGGGLQTGDASLSGPVFLWYPTRAALWAGFAAAGEIQDSNIGQYSIALGYENSATSQYTTAIGGNDSVSGNYATAIGVGNTVSGQGGVAVGDNNTVTSSGVAIGNYNPSGASNSVQIGLQAFAYGSNSVSIGSHCIAVGTYSFASGDGYAPGQYSAALGNGSAYGDYSFAAGCNAQTGANYAFAVGNNTATTSYNCAVFGAYNVGTGSNGYWNPVDPLFEIGNGTSSTAKSDAFVVHKNGNAQLQGALRCAQGGDLSMGTFTAGTNPALGQP